MSDTTAVLAPMVPSGKWMTPPNEPTHFVYVVSPEHQHRLLTRSIEEGGPWLSAHDPRDPQQVRIQSEEASLQKELDTLRAQLAQKEREELMRREIEELRAKMAVDFEGASPPEQERPGTKHLAKAR